MLVPQAEQLLRLEIAAPQRLLRQAGAGPVILQLAAEPDAQRHAEAHLAAAVDVRRQHLLESFLQDPLRPRQALQFEVTRQAEGEFQHLVVQEGRARLQGIGHGGDVHLGHQAFRQVGAHVHVGHPVEQVFVRDAREEFGEVALGVILVGAQQVGEGRAIDAVGLAGAEERHRGEVAALGGGHDRELQELLQPPEKVERRGLGEGAHGPQRAALGPGRHAGDQAVGLHADVAQVAAKGLVAAVAVERHGDRPARLARDEIGRQGAAVGVGLAVMPGQLLQHVRHVGFHRELGVVGAVHFGRLPGIAQLGEFFFLEADGEGLYRRGRVFGHQRRDDGGVYAARQEGPERHLRHQADLYRLRHLVAQALLELLQRDVSQLFFADGEVPVFFGAYLAVLEHQHRAGLELTHALEDAHRAGNILQGQVGVYGRRVYLARHVLARQQAAQLGGESEGGGRHRVEQRLLAHAVPRQHQLFAAAVPDGRGEHTAQLLGEVLAFFLVEVQDHLGVAFCLENVAAGQQALAQLFVVVDLAVEDYPQRAVFVSDGLVARGKVYDGQAAHGQPDVMVGVVAFVVRAAVDDEVVHGLQVGLLYRQARSVIVDSADAAHISFPRRWPAGRR